MSESAVRDCCLRKRMTSWNRSKRSWSSDGSPPAPAQILGHWPWRLPFSWRVTWKSDSSHFQEARTSSVNLVILDLLSLLSLQGRRAAARRAAFLSAIRDGIGRDFKNAPIANRSHLILNCIWSPDHLDRIWKADHLPWPSLGGIYLSELSTYRKSYSCTIA